MNGFIYIMSNKSFADKRIKIGISKSDPTQRKDKLYSTGVPEPFVVEYYALVEEYELIERMVHKDLSKIRPNKQREFFNCTIEKAIVSIRNFAEINYERIFYKTDEQLKIEQEELDAKREVERQRIIREHEVIRKEKEEKEKRNRTIFDNKFELGLDFKLNEANVLDNCPHCGKEINQNKLEK
jgi:hypothetical protein